MCEFFRGLRRKAGCVTLVMALSLMAGWMRSLYPDVPSPVPGQFVFAEQGWKIGYSFYRVGHAVHRFSLKDSCVTWERIQADAPIMVNNLIGVWLNASDANFPDVGIQSNDWIAKQEWCGFARGRFHLRDDRFNLRIARLVLPFWAIVIPLTLLSAVLILWPRKRPTKQSAPSLVAGKLSWTLSNAIMHDTQAKHDRLWKLIEEAQAESDQAKANSIFCDAEQLARHLHEAEPDDAEHCYAIALTYYHRWGTEHERGKCIDWLRKTEELDPTHPWVPLYLGYQFMDERRYAEAYAEFDRVNQDYFASRELHWRNIKTDELMIVALILGGSSLVDFAMLVHLADRYAEAAEIDQPVPTEIVKALADSPNRERFTVPAERVASEVCRLIRACGDVFPDELAALDSAAKAVG